MCKYIKKSDSPQIKFTPISCSSRIDVGLESILTLPLGYKLSSCQLTENVLTAHVYRTGSTSTCPTCGCSSSHTRGSYFRTLRDIPIVERSLVLHVRVRRFRCENSGCEQKYFSEPISELSARYSRRTNRCYERIIDFSKEMSSVKASGLLEKQGIHVSPSTCVRQLLKYPLPLNDSLEEVGIDDFANKKGHDYFSIIADQQKRRPVDLLDNRESSKVSEWFSDHPTIKRATRDRGKCFIVGMEAHRHITQISDRFHLIKNMTDALTTYISPSFIEYREKYYQSHMKLQQVRIPSLKELMMELSDRVDSLCPARNRKKIETWKEVYKMALAGHSISYIAEKTGLKSTKIWEIKKSRKEIYYTKKQKNLKERLRGIAQAVRRASGYKVLNVYKELPDSLRRNISKRTLQDLLFPTLDKYRQAQKAIKAQKKEIKEAALKEEKAELFKCFLFKGYQIKNKVVESFIENCKKQIALN